MSKSLRIRTTPGGDDEYIKVNVDLEQNFDFLEILSLKIAQAEEYGNFCSEYGVIAGRVIVNNGFGVPNVKISIFVPVEEADLDNEVIKEFYPYSTPFPNEKNGRGIRYNVLPDQQNTLDHTPVGTFREKRDTLDNPISLEIYEKYYKYTTTTNEAGDYILFGVPVGEHILHYDMDISDIGFLSYRPYELIAQGYSEKLFTNRFKFKSSNNIDSLTQIITENIPITVEPYWCDSLSLGSTLGINRRDISIDQIEIIPSAIFFGSIFSDDEKDSVNKNCRPDKDMGEMKEVITGEGKIEAIRRNFDGGIETYDVDGDAIDENGNWSIIVPMNLRKVVTDEFGELIPSPDGIKGVASEADFRFKISMDNAETDKRLRERAKFIVPNLTGNYNFGNYSNNTLKNSGDFKINKQLSEATQSTSYSADTTNQYNYLEDFYTFRWKKVYTVKQYIGRYQKTKNDEGRSFIGIKDIMRGEGVNKFPTNRTDTNVHVLYTIICTLLTFIGLLVGLINGIIMFLNGLITMICGIKFPVGIQILLTFCIRIFNGFCNNAYKTIPSACNGKCNKCRRRNSQGSKCNGSKKSEINLTLLLKWKCVLGGALCKKCDDYCTGKHSCCIDVASESVAGSPTVDPYSWAHGCPRNDKMLRDATANPPAPPNSQYPCCCRCCIKIPLIKLNCHDEAMTIAPSIIKTPFASKICNETFVVPFCCTQNCGGPQTAIIKDWVSCVMEPIAVWLRMLKFDFYNDWVSGSLYFPLIKRKFKMKKSNKKFGQIKKDKFCDFDCIIRDWGTQQPAGVIPGPNIDGIQYPATPPYVIPWTNTNNFQGPPFYYVHRVKIKRKLFTRPIVVDQRAGSPTLGCRAQFRSNLTTDWVGTLFTTQNENLNVAASTVVLLGNDNEGNGCQITFKGPNAFTELQTIINSNTDLRINDKERWWLEEVSTKHGKPEYVKTNDPLSGLKTWVNIGGHGHHKNICNTTRLIERGEYFKKENDCLTDALIDASQALMGVPDTSSTADGDGNASLCPSGVDCLTVCPEESSSCSISVCCAAKCGANGVKACNAFCDCSDDTSPIGPDIINYGRNIYHGMVTMGDKDSDLYYVVSMKPDDPYFNPNEYKANLFYPVTISELGSSTYCDIDEAPFVMDQLVPTTFNVSMEGLKYKLGDQTFNGTESNIPIKSIEDKDGTLNLRAYVEFSCVATVCLNAMGTVNHSQLGVEMIDKNDMGIEIGNCWTRFEHDADLREYFCRRFSGYKNDQLDVWYQKPGSGKFENNYGTYAEIQLHEGYDLTYQMPTENSIAGIKVPSEYNDGEFFIPGDACGYVRDNDTTPSGNANNLFQSGTDYFYGLAPGVTAALTNFPNTTNINLPDDPGHTGIGFGTTTDIINYIDQGNNTVQDDQWAGSDYIYAIRFNRSQTPYFFYFGLVPGKTSLHKVVGKFFADKINAVTLEGIKPGEPAQNQKNKPNVNSPAKNLYTIYKTCLGETQLPIAGGGYTPSGQTIPFASSISCDISLSVTTASPETQLGSADGYIKITATANPLNTPLTWTWTATDPFNAPGNGAGVPNSNAIDTTESDYDLAPDVYTISVIDTEGCTASINVPLGQGAPTCCQKKKLMVATVTDVGAAHGAQFCWSPCGDDNTGIGTFNNFEFIGTDPICDPYDITNNPQTTCPGPNMTTSVAPYASSARCTTYPTQKTINFPDLGWNYPDKFYICSCDDIRDSSGNIWNPAGQNGIQFTTWQDGAFCDNSETRLPEPVWLGDGPCVEIYETQNPQSYAKIDDLNDMGTIEDYFGNPIITKAAPVQKLSVVVPVPDDTQGNTAVAGDCPCPATLYFRVYGGTMYLEPGTNASSDYTAVSNSGAGVFNNGMPCVRAMIRIMKPEYDVKNYDTTRTDPTYPNILGRTDTKQRAIDYSQQEWYDSNGIPWHGQSVGFERDGPLGIFPWGRFTGATPAEISSYTNYSNNTGGNWYVPTTAYGSTAPAWCGTGGFGCVGFLVNPVTGFGADIAPLSNPSILETWWMPSTAITINNLQVWDYDTLPWQQYQPHENPNNTGIQDILTVGDYVPNVGDSFGYPNWSGWEPVGSTSSVGCSSNPQQKKCCTTVLTKMLWTPNIISGPSAYVANPVGEGSSTFISQDLNNSILYGGSHLTTPTPPITQVDHPWLQVNSQYNPPNGSIDGITGELTINLYKPGTYIIETALFQYQNGYYTDQGGFGQADCYMELYSEEG